MSYQETLNYLYNLQKVGIKLGLDNIERLMSAFDNPHQAFLSVHITGTNGKGSTSAILASILSAAGVRVGLFTSPHIVSFTERIKVNGEEISEHDVIKLATELKDTVEHLMDFSPTFFEIVTAMAMLYFKRKKVDIAVLEVGMGGRLDATNIVVPEVSVITNIGYDHMEFLGNTLAEIAREKAGIIKHGIPVVSSYQKPEAMEVIKNIAVKRDAEIYVYRRHFPSILKREDISGILFDYCNGEDFKLKDLFLPLTGEYQMINASLAIKSAMIVLNKNFRKGIEGKFLRDNLIAVVKKGLETTKWPGRFEIIKQDPPILIDGAHNPSAAMALSTTLKKNVLGFYKNIILVLGIMGDKDLKRIMEPLLPLASETIFTSPAYSRAASPHTLADIAISLGFDNFRIALSVREALKIASDLTFNTFQQSLIVITGSFYTIGEAKEVLGQRGVFARLRE